VNGLNCNFGRFRRPVWGKQKLILLKGNIFGSKPLAKNKTKERFCT